MGDRESETIYVQSSHLGMIIGRGGSMIKEITQETGCRINILKDEAEGDKTPVSLEGSSRDIEAAKARIKSITDRSNDRRDDRGGDRGYGGGRNDRGGNDRGYGGGNDRGYGGGNDRGYGGGRNDRGYGGGNDRGYNERSNNRY